MSEPLLAASGSGGSVGEVGGANEGERMAERGEMRSVRQTFMQEVAAENRRMWVLAAPAIFTSIAQYSLDAATQVFAGHLTTLDLDAVSIQNMVIGGLAYGLMLGMGSALETLCGQAVGAKQFHMLGIYMQRSWVILIITCLFLLPLYIFVTPILRLLGEEEDIAVLTGRFAIYMIPQLFTFALNFPIQKFLQAQSKVMAMAYISAAALVLHIVLSWLLIFWLGLGLVGAAISLNIAWWFMVLAQFAYIAAGNCPGAWTGFSWGAFKDLGAFAWLSIASAVMLCLEFWYLMFLIILVGQLKNARIAVAAVSICLNLHGWEIMVFVGFNAAISVRVSNELGAGRPRAAKFAVLVVTLTSGFIGLIFFSLVMALRNVYAVPFTNTPEVVRAVADLTLIFSFTLLLDSILPVLTGVAVGAGWQALVAYINLGCYYVIGLPVGYLLGIKLDMGLEVVVLHYYFAFYDLSRGLKFSVSWWGTVDPNLAALHVFRKHLHKSVQANQNSGQGMWCGTLIGMGLQALVLIIITLRTNWDKEAMEAESRIKKWGGSAGSSPSSSKRQDHDSSDLGEFATNGSQRTAP